MEETKAFTPAQQKEFLQKSRRLPSPPQLHLNFDDFPPDETRESPVEFAVRTVEHNVKKGAMLASATLSRRFRQAYLDSPFPDELEEEETDREDLELISLLDTPKQRVSAPQKKVLSGHKKEKAEYEKKRWFDTFSHIRNAVRQALEGINRVKLSVIALFASLLFFLLLTTLIALFAASPFGIFLTGEAAEKDSIPLSVAVHSVNEELNAKLEPLQHKKDYDEIHLTGDVIDWLQVLAVYAVNENQTDLIYALDGQNVSSLCRMYWSMVHITSEDKKIPHIEYKTTEGPNGKPMTAFVITYTRELFITISCKTAVERGRELGFSQKQMEALYQLLSLEDSLYDVIGSLSVLDANAKQAISSIPLETSQSRYLVAKKACSLVGKVSYFWGGKSYCRGWDTCWGQLKKVLSEDSEDTGLYMPYGLDCTGFVNWVFLNALGRTGLAGVSIPLQQAKVGDLVYTQDESHVGIVLAAGPFGPTRVIHCAKGYNGVVITDSSSFNHAVSPYVYQAG